MNQTLPSVNSEQQASLNDYLNLNIDELRTIIHQVFQLRAISNHCAADNLPKAESTLNKLLDDELNHIADTAEIIERQMMDYPAADLQDFFCKAVSDFNRAKSEEPIDYTYNQRFGNYP